MTAGRDGRVWPVCILLALTAAASWLAMMVVHELGHVLHGLLTGGRIAHVVLHPLAFSRTDLSLNPHPIVVAVGGFVWGTVLPVLAWVVGRQWRHGFLLRLWAGFCAIANGAYLAAGALVPAGDTEELLRLGVPAWLMGVAGLPLVAIGLALWNGLSREFRAAAAGPGAARVAAGALIGLVAAMLAWNWVGGRSG